MRPRELQADRVACERFAAAFDEHVRDWMQRHGFPYRLPSLVERFSSQPSPDERVRGAQQYTDTGNVAGV